MFSIGAVQDLRIPRPVKKDKTKFAPGDACFQSALDAERADEAADIGRMYAKLIDTRHAQSALKALARQSFAGQSIIAMMLNEDSQTTPPLNMIFSPQSDAPLPHPSS